MYLGKGRDVRVSLRVVLIVALLAMASSVMAGSVAARQGETVSGRHGTVYLALGDSTQVGEGASDPSNGLTALFFAYLESIDAADQYVNLAVGGESSSTFKRGQHSQLAQALAVINDSRTDVTVVTLGIGGNDVPFDLCIPEPETAECQAAFDTAMRTLARNLDASLRQLTQALARDPGAEQIILTAYYQPFSGSGLPWAAGFDDLWRGHDGVVTCAANAGTANAGLNDVISCVGMRHGATIADLFPITEGRAPEVTHIAEGDIHLNDAGYALAAAIEIAAYQD
jgi:lysophospholipase L1-like esterase